MAGATLVFLTPAGALLALAALLTVGGLLLAERRVGAARALLELAAPAGKAPRATILALVAVPALLAVAATQPVLRTRDAVHVRTDAQVLFVLDTSRSMAAAARPGAPDRLARAQAAAIRLRSAVPGVPAGVGTLTDRVLPNLFPTAAANAFDATVGRAVGIERPPPQQVGVTATTLTPLASVGSQGFFAPAAEQRVLVVLTDGETRPYSAAAVAAGLGAGRGVSLVLVHVWRPGERVFKPSGLPELAYLPREDSRQELDRLAAAAGGASVGEDDLDAGAAAIRAALGSGPTGPHGLRPETTALAPYAAAAGLLPLLLLLRPRRKAS